MQESTVITSRFFKRAVVLQVCAALLLASCTGDRRGATAMPQGGPQQTLPEESLPLGNLTVLGQSVDQRVLDDIAVALQASGPVVCAALQSECRFPVQVEVFESQDAFDQGTMNPEMKGYYAISGSWRIEMVSPDNPAPHEISYADAVQVAVHEYVHLVENEINPHLPAWLNEGVAVLIGPHEGYTAACQGYFPFEMIPDFQQLEKDYGSIPAADLFAFSLVEYITTETGLEGLNKILRAPDHLLEIMGMTEARFEAGWREYMTANYH